MHIECDVLLIADTKFDINMFVVLINLHVTNEELLFGPPGWLNPLISN